jgi:hypothetical protein
VFPALSVGEKVKETFWVVFRNSIENLLGF